MRARACGPLALWLMAGMVVPGTGAWAQSPPLAGTWRLDAARSTVSDNAGLVGLIGAGAPPTLHITQPANGTLVVESAVNEGHARLYAPHGRTTTPVGAAGTITVVATWGERSLAAEGTLEAPAGGSVSVRQVKEVYAVSADGSTLTITVTVAGDGAPGASSLTYTRLDSMGACETWPTPCKRAP